MFGENLWAKACINGKFEMSELKCLLRESIKGQCVLFVCVLNEFVIVVVTTSSPMTFSKNIICDDPDIMPHDLGIIPHDQGIIPTVIAKNPVLVAVR